MEKPKCKICGERHYGLCPSVPLKSDASLVEEKASRYTPQPARAQQERSAAPLRSRSTATAVDRDTKEKFDRAAYQREYMRTYLPKWRAAQKAKKPDA